MRSISLLLVSLGIIPASTMQERLVPDFTVRDRYSAPDLGEIRLLGICDAHQAPIGCWNPDQSLDKNLAKQVSSLINLESYNHVDTTPGTPFHFRRKRRIAVFQVPTSAINGDAPVNFQGVQSASFEYLGNISVPLARQDQIRNQIRNQIQNPFEILCEPFETEMDETNTSLYLTMLCKMKQPVDVPCKVGASASNGQVSVSIASIAKPKPKPYKKLTASLWESWNVALKIKGDRTPSKYWLEAEALDAQGKPIQYVDRDGRAAKLPVERGFWPGSDIWMAGHRSLTKSQPYGWDSGLDAPVWTSYIDPKDVTTLRLYFKTDRVVKFEGIPLDANPHTQP